MVPRQQSQRTATPPVRPKQRRTMMRTGYSYGGSRVPADDNCLSPRATAHGVDCSPLYVFLLFICFWRHVIYFTSVCRTRYGLEWHIDTLRGGLVGVQAPLPNEWTTHGNGLRRWGTGPNDTSLGPQVFFVLCSFFVLFPLFNFFSHYLQVLSHETTTHTERMTGRHMGTGPGYDWPKRHIPQVWGWGTGHRYFFLRSFFDFFSLINFYSHLQILSHNITTHHRQMNEWREEWA